MNGNVNQLWHCLFLQTFVQPAPQPHYKASCTSLKHGALYDCDLNIDDALRDRNASQTHTSRKCVRATLRLDD